MESDGIFMEDFLGTGMDGYYIDSSFEETKKFASAGKIELGPGVYEISIQYQAQGGPQKYKLDAENADFQLWLGNYHKELPENQGGVYTTLIWNGKYLHNFEIECDYSGDGYILFSGAKIIEKRGWVLAMALVCILLFSCMDLFFFRYRKALGRWNTERNRMVWGGCFFIIVFVSLPLFSGFLFYGHDLTFHLLRIEGIKDCLLSRQFPVRMQPN